MPTGTIGIPPGYTATGSLSAHVFHVEMVNGGIISKIPMKPFNGLHSIQMILHVQDFHTAVKLKKNTSTCSNTGNQNKKNSSLTTPV